MIWRADMENCLAWTDGQIGDVEIIDDMPREVPWSPEQERRIAINKAFLKTMQANGYGPLKTGGCLREVTVRNEIGRLPKRIQKILWSKHLHSTSDIINRGRCAIECIRGIGPQSILAIADSIALIHPTMAAVWMGYGYVDEYYRIPAGKK